MNYAEKVLCYVRRKIPDYEYSREDYTVVKQNEKIFICKWKLDMPEPNMDDLSKITKMEYDNIVKEVSVEDKLKNMQVQIDQLKSLIK